MVTSLALPPEYPQDLQREAPSLAEAIISAMRFTAARWSTQSRQDSGRNARLNSTVPRPSLHADGGDSEARLFFIKRNQPVPGNSLRSLLLLAAASDRASNANAGRASSAGNIVGAASGLRRSKWPAGHGLPLYDLRVQVGRFAAVELRVLGP